MDSVALSLLRQLRAEVDRLRREVADQGIEILERIDRLEQTRPAPDTDTAPMLAAMLAAIYGHFGVFPFLAVELMDWCRPCVDQAQRDAYRGICALCGDENPTPHQAGKVLRALSETAPGQWLVSRRGVRHNTALWGITPPSPQ